MTAVGTRQTRYDRNGTTERITEAELARDPHAVLEKVEQGVKSSKAVK